MRQANAAPAITHGLARIVSSLETGVARAGAPLRWEAAMAGGEASSLTPCPSTSGMARRNSRHQPPGFTKVVGDLSGRATGSVLVTDFAILDRAEVVVAGVAGNRGADTDH